MFPFIRAVKISILFKFLSKNIPLHRINKLKHPNLKGRSTKFEKWGTFNICGFTFWTKLFWKIWLYSFTFPDSQKFVVKSSYLQRLENKSKIACLFADELYSLNLKHLTNAPINVTVNSPTSLLHHSCDAIATLHIVTHH